MGVNTTDKEEKIIDFQKKSDEKWMDENENTIHQILSFIMNKDKLQTPSFEMKSIEDIQLLKNYLDKYIQCDYALLTSIGYANTNVVHKSYSTFFHITDRDKFLQALYDTVTDLIGNDSLFKVDLLTSPVSIMFHNGQEKLTLIKYDNGTIKC